ncbi:hypothetical protein UC3_02328 [Enterococcus phoeniculicola ATCC BAA-412]|uniref:HTH cro/C1-type domain-containing protein n=2 Tax=Enterococcus phoeniculicola TaxID=154621 RepID=R3WJE9_9ENTE|nr:helix-turn-helix transcriptional regulator [Enterococcus phoeniculicola]EOL41980.1 hypothetical protein UC3_02328 [Enterococcus phoeniculicola ATCC BAA-412]EOT79741.1 hypothetical protein I589_01253 [Enterococcus phoeniculicola ATCC BAA-412]
MSIGMKLKHARLASNLTQEELSEKIGVSRQTISSWENEKSYPDIINIILLSDIYEVTVDSLLKGDEGLLKNLKEHSDVATSKKQLIKIISLSLAFLIFYGLFFSFLTFAHIPRIDDLLSNILVLLISGIIVCVTLIKIIDFNHILAQKTSNKTLAMIIIELLYFLSLYVICYLINNFLIIEDWQALLLKIGIGILLFIVVYLMFRKIGRI